MPVLGENACFQLIPVEPFLCFSAGEVSGPICELEGQGPSEEC